MDHFDNMVGLREGCGKRQLRHPASSPPRLGPRRQHARFSWRKASDMPSRNRRYCLPRLKNRSTALRTRKGWRANSPHVPSDCGLVGHGGSGRFAVEESACRPERKGAKRRRLRGRSAIAEATSAMAPPLDEVASSRPIARHLLHVSRRLRFRRLPPTRFAGGRRRCRPVASWHPQAEPAVPAPLHRGVFGRAHRARRPSPGSLAQVVALVLAGSAFAAMATPAKNAAARTVDLQRVSM